MNNSNLHTRRLWMAVALVMALAAFAPLAPTAVAQNTFNVPYSQFGIGTSEQPYNMPSMARMGGVAYTRAGSNYVNPFNPASYGSVGMETLVFDMGLNVQISTLRDPSGTARDASGNLGHILMAFPVARWWKVGLGLMPYSMVDYNSVHQSIDPTYMDTVRTVYGGAGGINQVLLGSAFNILRGSERTPSLQVGVNLNWLTGGIDRTISYAFDGNDSTYFLNKRRLKRTNLNNLLFDFGLQMRQPIGTKYTLGLGLVYKPYADLRINDEALIYTYHASDETLVDTIFPARGRDVGYKSHIERAHTFGIGLSIERNLRWQLAFDATFASWEGMKYTEGMTPSLFGESILRYGPYSRYALGFERMGNLEANSYWRRISWSLGANYTNGWLRLEQEGGELCLNQWGIGAGVTFPMRKGRSLLTLSASYSTTGNADVLRRELVSFGISVSSSDRWFFKRKYD